MTGLTQSRRFGLQPAVLTQRPPFKRGLAGMNHNSRLHSDTLSSFPTTTLTRVFFSWQARRADARNTGCRFKDSQLCLTPPPPTPAVTRQQKALGQRPLSTSCRTLYIYIYMTVFLSIVTVVHNSSEYNYHTTTLPMNALFPFPVQTMMI